MAEKANEEDGRGYVFLPKTADAKFQASGKNLSEALINSALAMFSLMVKEKVAEKADKEIRVSAEDIEHLCVKFLDELLFLIDSEEFILSKIKKIKIEKKNAYFLSAVVSGDNLRNYTFREVVKAVTFNELKITEEKKKTTIQMVLDT
ncbi:MAG: archease [Candidatus Woesearchaeota archaeon]|nr:archease [Candidatus Woesearchaeota archaeon]